MAAHRERIKPYGSLLMAEPAETADRVRAAIERGFRALKLGWGPFGRRDAATDEAIVRAARDAAGAAVELMVDAGASDAFWPHGYKWALRTAHMLAAHDIVWFEEPLRPDDIDGYAALTRTAPLPIAGGEVLTRRQSFLPWIERRAVDYLQPDVTKVGGLTEEHRIGQYADDHGILLVPHGWNTAVGLAADLQLVAAAGNARWVEYITPRGLHRRPARRAAAPRRRRPAGHPRRPRPGPRLRPRRHRPPRRRPPPVHRPLTTLHSPAGSRATLRSCGTSVSPGREADSDALFPCGGGHSAYRLLDGGLQSTG